jgi:hypothetical protein
MAAAGFLFGNQTDFGTTPTVGVSTVQVTVLGSLILAGNHFHPGEVTFLWDKTMTIGTATVNATGFFNTTVTIPITQKGDHNITIDDGKCGFIIWVEVIPTLILTPDQGPVGTIVTATGYGFPASDGTKYNVTLWWDYACMCYECPSVPVNLTAVQTNTNGHFVTTFVVPHTVGGAHLVWAEADDAPIFTYAEDWFTVIATLTITPSIAMNDGTIVVISGTGLMSYSMEYAYYDLCLDYEKDFYIVGNCSGDFEFTFIVTAGYEPGIHVASLYSPDPDTGNPSLETHEFFTVTSEEETAILDTLEDIADDLEDLEDFVKTDSSLLNTHLNTIQADIATAKEAIMNGVSGLSSQLTSIESYAQDAAEKATSAATSAGSAAQAATDAKTAAESAQSTTSGISTAVYGAIVLSLVAALASIVAVITLQRKVA